MSVLAPPEPIAVERIRRDLPGTATVLRVELAKLREQLAMRVLLAVCVLAPLGFATVMRIQGAVPADTLFGRWAKTTGFASPLTVLGFAGSWGFPLLAGIVAGDMFSSEDRYGTWKTLLTRSCSRGVVFAGKGLAACVCAIVGVCVLALSGLVSSVLLVDTDPLVGLSGQLVSPGRAVALVLSSWAYSLLPVLSFVALGLMLSVVTRSGIAGVLGPPVVALVMQLLTLLGPGEIVRAVLPTTPFDGWHGLFVEPVHARPVFQGAETSIVYTGVFLAVAWHVFSRRAIAGSEAVPHRRRQVQLQTAIGATAVVVLLAAGSGWGPTDITAKRLERTITPTFERLVVLQYRWRTDRDPGNATLHAITTCRRGGGSRPARGAGDDWTCVVKLVSPELTAKSMTLDLTVRPNGCYTAQAPPSIIGPLVLRDARGKAFVNPLFAFDGCFGTT